MLFREKTRYAAALLGVMGLVGLWASAGSGAPEQPVGDHRTALFYVA
jgi:hypothetical protein